MVLVEWHAGLLSRAEVAVKVGSVLVTQSLQGALRARLVYPTCSARSPRVGSRSALSRGLPGSATKLEQTPRHLPSARNVSIRSTEPHTSVCSAARNPGALRNSDAGIVRGRPHCARAQRVRDRADVRARPADPRAQLVCLGHCEVEEADESVLGARHRALPRTVGRSARRRSRDGLRASSKQCKCRVPERLVYIHHSARASRRRRIPARQAYCWSSPKAPDLPAPAKPQRQPPPTPPPPPAVVCRQRPTPRRLSRAGQGRTSEQPRVGRTRANGGVRVSERAGCYGRSRPHQPICDGKHISIDTRAGPVFGVPEPPRREPAADRHRSRLPLAAVAAPALGPRRAALVNRSERSPLATLVTTDKLAGGIAAAHAHARAWPRHVYSTARAARGRLRPAAGRRAWILRRGPTARRDGPGGDRPAGTLRIARDRIAHPQPPRVRAQTA